jgi:hypothetical protein
MAISCRQMLKTKQLSKPIKNHPPCRLQEERSSEEMALNAPQTPDGFRKTILGALPQTPAIRPGKHASNVWSLNWRTNGIRTR